MVEKAAATAGANELPRLTTSDPPNPMPSLASALQQENAQAIKRRLDAANGRLDRLAQQEKSKRRRKTSQDPKVAPTLEGRGERVFSRTTSKSRANYNPLLMTDVQPPAAAASKRSGGGEADARQPRTEPLGSDDAAPPQVTKAAIPATPPSHSGTRKPKTLPIKKPNWRSLEQCVASWEQWEAEGRLVKERAKYPQ